MHVLSSLLAIGASVSQASPPAAASAFLSAVDSGDIRAARAALSEDIVIMDDRLGSPVASSLEAFATYVHGCARTDLTWDVDQADATIAAVSVAWTCPSRPRAQAFIWTDRTGIVHILFRLRPPR